MSKNLVMGSVKDLLGRTLKGVFVDRDRDEIIFNSQDGETFKLYHDRDCCEVVRIEDITGDLLDLVDSPVTMAEEITSEENPKESHDELFLWTFYRFATVKGYVTIRWYGESNGYYSVRVDFRKIEPDER